MFSNCPHEINIWNCLFKYANQNSAVCMTMIMIILKLVYTEAATWGVLSKKVLLKILQNSQENTCARLSFSIKLQALFLQLYGKRDSGTGVFLWILRNFKKHLFYRTLLDDCFYSYLAHHAILLKYLL